MIKKVPIPIAGLALALLALGNISTFYDTIYRNIFGALACILLSLLLIKIIVTPKSILEDLKNPLIASVVPTFSMSMILLSTYIKPFSFRAGYCILMLGIILHLLFILAFTLKYIVNFDIKRVFPSYFVVFYGIVCASVAAPSFGLDQLGRYIIWFGLACFLPILPLVLYRTFVVKKFPDVAKPTWVIFTAPVSLSLAAYLKTFPEKSPLVVNALTVLALLVFTLVLANMPRLLKLRFYPSYSAFTFPFVITATAMGGARDYFISSGKNAIFLTYVAKITEFWAVAIVAYVFIRYVFFLATPDESLGGNIIEQNRRGAILGRSRRT